VKSESERLLAEARSWERELERMPYSPMLFRERRTIEIRVAKLRRDAKKARIAEVSADWGLGGDAA
jgi:hypothetical protein